MPEVVRGGTPRQMHTMPNQPSRNQIVQHLSRRRILAIGGGLLASGTSIAFLSQPAQASASVSVDSFNVPDASFEAEEITPVLDVDVAYSYDVGQEPVGDIRLALLVGGDSIAQTVLRTDRATLEGDTTLTGRITDSSEWSSSDFSVAVGEQVTRTLNVDLVLEVRDSSESVIVEDTASVQPSVGLEHPQANTWNASVGGEGVIRRANQ